MENHSNSSDPMDHTPILKKELTALIDHLRADAERVHEPQAKALFETSAEVLLGLHKAFSDYEAKSEKAWIKNSE
jgi:hypothetical protein